MALAPGRATFAWTSSGDHWQSVQLVECRCTRSAWSCTSTTRSANSALQPSWGTEESRRRQQHSARQLGLLGARSSEAIGAAIGAVGAAGAAASRYFVHGAVSGAQHAWAGSAYAAPAPAPGLQVQVPRPEYLPAPLPFEPSYSSSTPFVSEDAGAASRERQQEQTCFRWSSICGS